MVETTAIFITYILFFFFGIVGLYYWNLRLNVRQLSSNVPDPATVVCSESSILDAWIFNYGQIPACPAFTNNFVVAGAQRTLYEKDFITDTGTTCCYYSNDVDKRTEVDFPWIIIGNLANRTFTLGELNDKIYKTVGQTVYYNVSVCDNNATCLGMVRVGLADMEEFGRVGLYKIYKFRTERIVEFVGDDGIFIPDDRSTQIALTSTIVVEAGGKNILAVYDDDFYYCNRRTEGLVCYDEQPILEQLEELSNGGYLNPIAGANPVLSNLLVSAPGSI